VTRGRAKRWRGEVGEFCLLPAAAPLAASCWILAVTTDEEPGRR
jgi:hypothetical protein